MDRLVVSIVVIALNEVAVVDGCLSRLQRQIAGDRAVEVIVADGGSTDGTAEIAARYARVVTAPRGRAAGLNAGAAAAQGDTLLFLHADTYLPDGALDMIRRVLKEPSVVGGRFRVALDNPALPYRIIATSINLRDRLLGGHTGDQAAFVRAEVFRRMGGYADIPLMEDLDFARRLGREGRVVRLPQAVTTSARRWSEHGVVRTIFLMWTLRLSYYLGVAPQYLAPFYRDAR
ncbi:MAG: TIGR04283 family arsenosugar biosynthesis glycosyltransferase [Chloroflexi bacterium]|nr:TIGR04283 family arsenosugar biosynthesis glycosyltransferase [Chloroflexota bacterium]